MAEYHFNTPITEEEARKLKAGDTLFITGEMVTGRDAAHKRALDLAKKGEKEKVPVNLEGKPLYFVGPLVKKENGQWKVVAAGPTTATRMDMFEPEFLKEFKTRVLIGKGAMLENTMQGCKEVGAIYASYTGGAAALAAKRIKRVKDVHWLDLGTPEAMWVFEVEEFGPLTVDIDSHGRNLHKEVNEKVKKKRNEIFDKL
ncbi:MAG: fumarate hydratase [Candidatus Korarchaeota archaeon]|nr:fumarate hydratase [Candidatus Korarchaeota archaeon]NIU85320.1 fumarate hydratase [Candidatus Thorarchaeota archaeon]NIW13953.1 fumarate hydratase [Candidatus Thorarchaeota archaeon]NIW52092.1 fumarate hydratase [Candidatus Korarchaeota archaeon]